MLAAQPGGRVERAACSERATCRSPPCHSPQAHRNTLGPLAFASIMPRVLRMPPPTCCDSVEARGWVGSTSAARASMQGDQHASLIVLIWAHKERCQAARMGGCTATTLLPSAPHLDLLLLAPAGGPLLGICTHRHHACISAETTTAWTGLKSSGRLRRQHGSRGACSSLD